MQGHSLLNKYVTFVQALNKKVGESCSFLLLAMALLTFIIVVFRYVFHMGWVWLQELVVYFHAILFLMTSAYALKEGGHVRVDIFYEKLNAKNQALVNLLGGVFLLLPTCIVILCLSFPYVLDSWSVLEASQDGAGLPGVFLLKTFIVLAVVLLALQGTALLVESYIKYKKGPS